MRQWGFPIPADELVAVEHATTAFRHLWAAIRPPWSHSFDGSVNDVRAIDYLDYEGIAFPECGVEGAALVCGEVLRKAAELEWVCSYRGDWYIASPTRTGLELLSAPSSVFKNYGSRELRNLDDS